MWTSATWLPAHSIAVSVVPMPCNAGSDSTMRCRLSFAALTVCSSAASSSVAGRSLSSARSASIAAALAISPPTCPPIPSATASRCAPAYAESSLPSRSMPTSERAA